MKHAGRSALRLLGCALLVLGTIRPAAAQSVTGTILVRSRIPPGRSWPARR